MTAWSLGTPPNASILNWVAGDTIANTTIVPILPGIGNDFTIYVSSYAHVIIDVVGYYAAPAATALACTVAYSPMTLIPSNNYYTDVTATCPAGYAATGGGNNNLMGDVDRTNVIGDPIPTDTLAVGNSWGIRWYNRSGQGRYEQTWAQCCRVPGR
jgi:hypothetical protein